MGHTAQILVVDDDRAMRETLSSLFKERGLWVEEAGSAQAALELAAEREFDVVLSDIRMPGLSGIELVGQLRRLRPNAPVILMTAFGTIDSAAEAMRAGAFDYVTKPFEPDAVTFAVDRAIERSALSRENETLRAQPWRGNARELENTIEPAIALSDVETLGPANIPLPASAAPASAIAASAPDLDALLRAAAARGMSLHELDEKYTAIVLGHTSGNKVRASQILGIDRKTLYRRAERRTRDDAAHAEE